LDKIRILLVDDHTILRSGIRSLLEDEPGMSVIGEAEDGRTAVSMACQLKPDVVIMDIAMPLLNGLEATRQIKAQCPGVRVLILTMHDNEEYIRQVLEAGAMGYILKDAAARELISAIRSVYRGESVLSPAVTRLVIEDYLRWGGTRPQSNNDVLSPREREVLQLIAEERNTREIGTLLNISPKTVETHRSHLMDKLDIHTTAGLTRYAIGRGLVGLDR